MQLKPGTQLQGGKYLIIRTLGQGGFGITYEAEQVLLRRKVAVKEFFMKDCCERNDVTSRVTVGTGSQKALVEKFREKFIREAQMIAGMDHPHIVRVLDVFEDNGTAYYVMDYLPGSSLADKVRKDGPLSEASAEEFIRQVADALAYIHSQNTVHLDVKPSNILLNAKGEAVLIDFGISKHYDDSGEQTSSTPVGISKGYAPLEQGRNGDVSQFKPSTDIYALGATLYYLVTGIVPPEASIVNEDGMTKPQGIKSRIWNTIEKAMQPRRKDRPQDICSFLALLDGRPEDLLSEDNEETMVAAKQDDKATSSPTPELKRKWLWALIAGLGLFVSLGLFFKRPSKQSDFSLGTSISTTSNPDSISQISNEVPVPVESSKIEFKQNRRELTTKIGHKFKLIYSRNSTKPISWMSSNTSVLTVDKTGTITVRGAGTATITASIDNEYDACICVIHLLPEEEEEEFTTPPASATNAPTGFGAFMYLSRDKITLKVGESFFLTAYDYGTSLSWESNNPKVATVSSTGSVTAHEPGKAFIWAHGSSKSIACLVTVIGNNNPTSSISSSQSENAIRSTYSKDVHIKLGESIQIKISDVLVDKWVSDNTRIATVNSTGVITGISSGETNVWYYAEGNPHRCFVHVE